MSSSNPLEIKVTDFYLQKFNGSDKLSIFPQFVELSIFQSIFQPNVKAQALINDSIGLFANYPLTGEEIVTIQYEQLNGAGSSLATEREFKFIISGIKNIVADDRARSLMYQIDLVSVEFLQNTRKYVSHAYNDLVEDMAEQVYTEYVATPTQEKFASFGCKQKPFKKEESLKVRSLVVPNLRPINAMQWLIRHAIAKDPDNYFLYLFYEDTVGYNFVTLQKLIEDARNNYETLKNNKYKYVSDSESSALISKGTDQDLRLISNIVNNKRFSSVEKIMGGYYQNELFEISLLQKSYNSTPSELQAPDSAKFKLGQYALNNSDYVNYVKNQQEGTEYSNRVRYTINNYDDSTQPFYRSKFGNATRYLYALNQIDLSITVPANMDIKAGDIIYCEIPEVHGFNNVETDKYLVGLFLVAEVKQVLSFGNLAATTMRIHKDGYFTSLIESSLYNSSGGVKMGPR